MTAIEKYIWVVNALFCAGERGLSLKELNDKWVRDISVSNGAPLPRQTFDRWKGNILLAFGVNIECNLKGGYRYYISNPESLSNGETVRWLLDAYSTANTLSQSIQLKGRIQLEEIPSNRSFLTIIIEAMKEDIVLLVTYKNFVCKKSYTFPIEPYCLKMFQKRWYLLARSVNDGRMRIYGLDRFENVEVTTERFSMPKDFDAKEYFSTFFGIVADDSVATERIVIRAYKQHQQYVRSLPIHSSQKELCANDAYADFELRLRPTYDFIMELLHAGNMVEVMEPQALRKTMKAWASGLWVMYKNE